MYEDDAVESIVGLTDSWVGFSGTGGEILVSYPSVVA